MEATEAERDSRTSSVSPPVLRETDGEVGAEWPELRAGGASEVFGGVLRRDALDHIVEMEESQEDGAGGLSAGSDDDSDGFAAEEEEEAEEAVRGE